MQTYFVEDQGYWAWLSGHPDGVVAKVRSFDGRLVCHRVWCEKASPRHIRPGGMVGLRLCAETISEIDRWAGELGGGPGVVDCRLCSPRRSGLNGVSF